MKSFLVSAMLLLGGIAQAQVVIEGNVYGGGNMGTVLDSTTVVVNGGTVGKKIPLIDRTIDQNLQLHSRVEYGNVYGGGNGFVEIGTHNSGEAPDFDIRAGLVKGNTNVTIKGDAVVRRAVYGGGNMASVGDYTANDEYAPAEGKGRTIVTITGNALIGPKKEDLTKDDAGNPLSGAEIDTAFRYLGSNEGWVFGSSRGVAGDALKEYSFVNTTSVIINDSAQALNVFGSGENGHVLNNTNVLIAGNALIGGVPLHNTGYAISSGTYSGVTVHLYGSDGELVEDEFGVGRLVTRGNVFGGGKGSDFISWLSSATYSYSAGRVYGNATVNIQDNAQIYNRVFGGGLLGSVGTFKHEDETNPHAITGVDEGTGLVTLTISGGTIGSPGSNGHNNGEVYGGGRGIPGRRSTGAIDPLHQALDLAYVGNTLVTVSGGTVMNSVYGGAANGHVQEDSKVVVSGGTIGTTGVGGWHGNVFAGGGGTTRYKDNNTLNLSITAGRVFGDTELEMTGGHVLHNVYGGGAIASVGTYDASNVVNPTHPYLGHGKTTITITGGEVGTNGNNNGMVYGSGRGQIAEPGNFLDYVTYVAYSEVNIGTGTVNENGEASNLSGNAKINGSVYGSGENGHVYLQSQVNVFKGTIGIAAADYNPSNPDPNFLFRGNVYGAGCGTDQYIVNIENPGTDQADTTWAYNPLAGMVQGNTEVNIYGGYISRNVYGGGAMASVGSINHPHTVKHLYVNHETEPSLSWPYELEYTTITDASNDPVTTGKTEVNIRGGHIGTLAAPIAECGNVFGSARGDVGPLGVMDTLAIVRETEVNINFTPSGTSIENETDNCIVGSVYGSGENGTVYDKTKITIDNGIIGGSVFGGGDGTDTYMVALKNPDYDPEQPESQTNPQYLDPTMERSITSGKVYGNTEIVINGGQVLHNVYGGGNLASVGKGNYMGYGEMSAPSITPSPTPYQNSGICTVTVTGGTIGTTGYPGDGFNNGYVFGSSKGTAFKTVNNTPRYDYSRDFFLGYTNKTIVNIGSTEGEGTGPEIKGSVFGGGDNGHVRWHTNVTVNKGEIGAGYDPNEGSITDDKWAYRGNVYGAGRGIDKYDSDGNGTPDSYCTSAGSVTLNTNVTVNGGTIHRNVYGGGSMASVGPPPTTDYNPGTSKCTVNIYGGSIGQVVTPTGEDPFNYGGNVYGAGRGIIDPLAPLTRFASASNAEVNVDNGSGKVIGNVYGGGSYGQVKKETNVNMIGGSVEGSIFGGGMGIETEEIAGLVEGNATVDMTGGTVKRSVYGGGQMGSVGTFIASDTITYSAGPNAGIKVPVPKTCKPNTGLATVTMSGGSVGLNGSLMPWTNHNPDDDDRGWIFCGGQGVADSITYPKAIALGVVNCTHLQISNSTSGANTIRPVVTASVYGGAENGLVLDSTFVEIAGGQIGTGLKSKSTVEGELVGVFDGLYTDQNWTDAIAAINNGTIEIALGTGSLNGVFHECDAWEYGDNDGNIKVYDINYGKPINPDDPGSALYQPEITALQGTNGHSFFGNVFGGGSGYYPIAPGVWRPTAGQVNGNTRVEITGGHILTAVYGGNETTDVKGKSTVKMSGGTVGIPRTMASIQARPVNGNIFGAGMGDPRTMFNAMTNVKKTQVYLTGGTVFGNVYGGSREGHVLDSTLVVIRQEEGKSTLIGTTGFSGYDGLVFGGGRGKDQLLVSDTINGKRQFPVGRVGGNTHVTMSQGKVLGNIYGGGQVGLVGVDENGWITSFVQGPVYDSINHGLSKVEVSGGTIGNSAHNGDDLLRSDQTAGNVYGGGRGDLDEFVEDDLGRVAKAIVNISGNPDIYGSVFGGGQMANVGYWIGYGVGYAKGTSASGVNIIDSPKIGTAHEFGLYNPDYQKTQYDTINGMRMISHTRTGNVFGGGQGNVQVVKDDNNKYHVLGLEHGHCGKTTVSIGMNNGTTGGQILGSVFGGSEQGAVWYDTKVTVTGGTIGKEYIDCDTLKYVDNHWEFVESDSTYSYGSVYGGSYGADIYKHFNINDALQPVIDSVNLLAGRVYGNTTVEITGGAVRGNVFGGGDIASVGEWNNSFVPTANTGKATVTIGGSAVIGPLDWTGLNAYVYGGGKGFSSDPNELRKADANLNNTKVTVNGGTIYGSVFGGGSDSHTLGDVEVYVHSGANIGTNGLTTWDGNIFGGGRNFLNTNHTNGRVAGNIKIEMDGGTMLGTIFGGGRLALSGVNVNGVFPNDATTWDPASHGNVTINVSGGEIGNGSDQGVHLLTENDESVGDIFGGGKGDTKNKEDILAGRVTNTEITITGNTRIHGAVFGGGEMASIGWWNNVGFINNTGEAEITIGTLNGSVNPEIGTYLELNPAYLNDEFSIDEHTYQHSEWTVFDTVGGVKKLIHTCTGNVIGGCQGDVDFDGWVNSDSTTWNKWPYMGRSRTSTITINGGTIMSGVFGGPEQGTMDEDAYVTVNGGTIGSLVSTSSREQYYFGGVYGAGYGSDDPEEDDHSITVNGVQMTAKERAGRVYGDTQVDVLGGTIQGDVYGGANFAYVGDGASNSIKGNTQVNIGSQEQIDAHDPDAGTTILGEVYAANNHAGTPWGNVRVDVYHTQHNAINAYPDLTGVADTLEWIHQHPFTPSQAALKAVYGGSNKADYTPLANKTATAYIHECSENTIYRVFGGSNAANVGSSTGYETDSYVKIEGGRIGDVFGGGNGEVRAANTYGTANTTIDGGLIDNVFGAGNAQGTVNATNLVINDGGSCPLYIYNIFGGGNIAPIIGDVVTTIECGEGSYDNFYGGSNFADIFGDVTVNVFGGTYNCLFGGSRGASDDGADIRSFPSYAQLLADYQLPEANRQYSQSLRDYMHFDPEDDDEFATDLVGTGGNVTTNLFGGEIREAAYGGSDVKGVIDGKIQVNVFNIGGNCGLDLEDLYGAGRQTPYQPIYALGQSEAIRLSPEVNIIHGTVKGNVYGGGQGLTANTVGTNPVVNMGYYDAMGTTSIEGSLIDRLVDTVEAHHYSVPTSYIAQVGRDYTNIQAYNGKGNIYGGGELAQVTDSTFVYIHTGTVKGSVYGGGKGQASLIVNEADTVAGRVRGNTLVDMSGGLVERSIYGGGELASVGTFTEFYNTAVGSHVAGEPKKCKPNTGFAKVRISGGQVGKNEALMPTTLNPHNDEYGYVFCGGKGVVDSLTYPMANLLAVVNRTRLEIMNTATETTTISPVVTASVYGGSENGLVLGNTHVKMTGGQIGTGCYQDNSGIYHWDGLYDEDKWTAAKTAINNDTIGTALDLGGSLHGYFHECDHWPYGRDTNNDGIPDTFEVYDIYADQYDSHGGATEGSNGHTFFGNVFGGGSGFYPFWDAVNDTAVWRCSAGRVWGNTLVEIEGGHILTSVYGGNEVSDVMGKATVNMTGGTIGVPRTIASIQAHPVTCYLYGAGMGDPRIMFNTWTNVANSEVNIGGNAFLFGSAFGGGEDGHVLGNVTMNISSEATQSSDDVHIGTWGYSYVDGNVFGGGRGFDGNALTVGSVGGNITLNIYSGTILGSVYGGGRLASVGCGITAPDDPNYGQMQPGDDHGIVRVNISGGTIGNDYESKLHLKEHTYGGNVYGGSMGRLTLLDGITVNELWPNLGKVKNTYVTISGANTIIKGNVYGGSEMGTLSSNADDVDANRVSGSAFVTIEDGTIWRNVFGGSYGSIDTTMLAPLDVQTQEDPYEVTPMQRAGRIDGNTKVEIKGGWVKKCVYGAGEMASVGTITEEPVKHVNENECFALSWPYEFKYQANTGIDTVLVTGGRIGLTGKDYMGPWNAAGQPIYYTYDNSGNEIMHVYTLSTQASMDSIKAAREDNGDVYGGGKGKAGDRYEMAHCANSSNTVVIIEYPETNTADPGNYKPGKNSPLCLGTIGEEVYDFVYRFIPTYSYNITGLSEQWSTYHNRGCLPGSLYGGGENGHVNDSTYVTLENGLIGHSIYGGGKGTDTYVTTLYDFEPYPGTDSLVPVHPHSAEVTSITAGKVYGNTYVTMNGGYVVRSVFGGGNRASVGKGNYAGGPGDFTPQGYGERWPSENSPLRAFLANSGHTYVNIFGGTVGTIDGMKDGLPTGNVFGSSRGEPAPNVRQTLHPRILYYPEFFLGYANHTHVTIGETPKATPDENSPRLYGSVFGGGEDGHVRWSTEVIVNDAEIGNKYDSVTIVQLGGNDNLTDYQWRGRGSVHGAGAGLGKYKDANNQEHFSTSAGSVTQFTEVTINGGIIHQNVYGGGPLSSVGPPAMGQSTVPDTTYSLAKVNIHSAIGDEDVVIATEHNTPAQGGRYGGCVFGASRGVFNFEADPALSFDRFATTMFTEVNLYAGAQVPGNVYGGGQLGQVKNDTKVNMLGGTVGTIGYIRKQNTASTAALDSIVHTSGGEVFGGGAGYPLDSIAALVKGNTEVNIKGGHVLLNVYGGGEMASVGQHTDVHAVPNDENSLVVNILPVENTGLAKVTVTGGQVGPAPMFLSKNGSPSGTNDSINILVGLNSQDGYVFGGGRGEGNDPIDSDNPYGRFYAFANVNNTLVTIDIPMPSEGHPEDSINNRIWGSVFGGAEDGHVLGNTRVNYVSGYLGTDGTTSYDGNIFGGGRNFHHKNYTAGRVGGNTNVEMSGGQLFGNIYGGGRLALTGAGLLGLTQATGHDAGYYQAMQEDTETRHGYTKVVVKGGTIGNNKPKGGDLFIETFTEHSMGSVYGGGMGTIEGIDVTGHPKSSSLLFGMTKYTEVIVRDSIRIDEETNEATTVSKPHIYGIVFGGGETANVGKFTWKQTVSESGITISDIDVNEGKAVVNISGGIIGADRAKMRYEKDPLYPIYPRYNDDLGYVYGGGEGESKNPTDYDVVNTHRFGDLSLLDLMTSVYETDVTVSGGWVKASVFGGAESGHVMGNTKVTISGGQIGAGRYVINGQIVDSLYKENQFVNPTTTPVTSQNALRGTTRWTFGKTSGGNTVYNPYDPSLVYYNVEPSDGKSWFGNVFGGGSGWFPYFDTIAGVNVTDTIVSRWNSNAGKVWGNSEVIITGGHILNNVYGANEATDVVGKATITMSGGTIGVPRINDSIIAQPVMGYLFGGGCGDPRVIADGLNNVDSTNVTITGGIIYGSALGGAEDGHVLSNAKLTVQETDSENPTVIGTSGCSGVDGNLFGGGRNFLRLTYAAGRVGGNTTVNMTGGKVLGCIYGGGRNALVGFNGNVIPTGTNTYQALTSDAQYGHTKVTVSGGTVGNRTHMRDSKYPIGDVFGAGKGSKEGIVGHPLPSTLLVSLVKATEVEISGTARIYGSVYGGGEISNVGNYTWKQSESGISNISYKENTGHTKVAVKGGTIGMDNMQMITASGYPDDWGHVFGGGQGWVEELTNDDIIDQEGNHLVELMATAVTTEVEISDSAFVLGSVYGGAENGHVTDSTWVKIMGGQIGAGDGFVDDEGHNKPYTDEDWASSTTTLAPTAHWNYVENGDPYDIYVKEGNKPKPGLNGATFFGNVFGGGSGYYPYGVDEHGKSQWLRTAGQVWGNTRVEVTGGHILSCLYGGCEVTNVGRYTYNEEIHGEVHASGGQSTVVMSDGTIGVPRTQAQIEALPVPGYLYGSGKGDPRIYFNTWTNVWASNVAVSGGRIYGGVFGGGEDGHVMGDVTLSISEAASTDKPTIIGCGGFTSFDGNVFGGGHGTTTEALTAGSVSGNVTLTVTGGTIHNSVYGGGFRGSVGTYLVDTISQYYGKMRDDDGGHTYGYTYVTVGSDTQQSKIEIGNNAVNDHDLGGNVFGGCRGDAGPATSYFVNMAKVKQTEVNIKELAGSQTWIEGSVFGSGEDGHVLKDTYVNIHGGQIGGSRYGNHTPCPDPYHGNVYGGGRGLDTWTDDHGDAHYSLTAGKVYGNSNVNVYGGNIIRNVYGGGNIASVGDYRVNTHPETGAVIDTVGPLAGTGLAKVRILGGTIGVDNNTDNDHGNVFGSSHGVAGRKYKDLAFVHNSIVEVDSVAAIYGSVFGGGEDGRVTMNTVVNVSGGTIGFSGNNEFHGNVYGGGRGIDKDEQDHYSPTAGEVYGKATVNIQKNGTYDYTPTIYHNVYGGGSASVVHVSKVVNVADGNIKGSVFGGSRHIPTERENKSPRFVNMWGGTVDGDVYGCSYQGIDGDTTNLTAWASFINMSGGTVKGSVYGAGYQGEVKGSVGVLIGKNAIEKYSQLVTADSLRPSSVTAAPLDIKGNVYAGSNFFGSQTAQPWRTFDITGYSNVYIDGEGYKTGSTGSDPEMIIRGGLYGSGTNCESGAAGRDIVIRKYGERNMYDAPSGGKDLTSDSLVSVTRTFTTIQRVGNLFLDHANIALTGARDISNLDGLPNTYYGVYQVDTSMVVCNGSSIVLGNAADPAHIVPAYIDSVKVLRSVRLDESVYGKFFLPKLAYTWIGVKDTREDIGLNVNLYYYGGSTALDRDTEENVIIFKGLSQLFVRYHIGSENQYGELQGFFRMSSPYKPRGTESFAYARQKVAPAKDSNTSDGGFASYYSNYNFFTDGGAEYTKTKQYPYTNIISDPVLGECRGWFIPEFNGNKWYVDGTGTRGGNNGVWASDGGGRFPDKPKLTIVGSNDVTNQSYSIIGDHTITDSKYWFNSETDIIYVVGAVSGVKELVGNTSGKLGPNASHSTLPLRIYRYPGGHKMSNESYDYGPSGEGTTQGPGPWYGTMLSLDDEGEEADQIMTNKTLVLDSVMIDGLYSFTPGEIEEHEINIHVPSASYYYHGDSITAPLATVNKGALLMKGNTELKRGYNNHDAAANLGTVAAPNYNFYVNPDFDNSVINGGGVYVAPDASAKVQVEGIVTITGNRQKKGSGTIESNVYLPTFDKHIEITNPLDSTSVIGVTSPNRNTAKYYWDNTFSPVAVGVRANYQADDAKLAWTNNNFRDDQGWFFSNHASKDTYYLEKPFGKDDPNDTINERTVYFGWTWANVVRTQPAGYAVSGNNITVSSEEGLAWLISQTTAINGAPLTNFSGKTISLTNDLNLRQYVWVPIGSEINDVNNRKFSGTFDGQGHLIDSLFIEYTSLNDHRYGRTNYGLFGDVAGGKIKRTFVVGGLIQPGSTPDVTARVDYNIGGLVGYLENLEDVTAVISESEAAVKVYLDKNENVVVGGLVGQMSGGEIHSSMAMPEIVMGDPVSGLAGGLVGKVEGGKVNNSFANAMFSITKPENQKLGGLLGSNANATVENCYVNMHDSDELLQNDGYLDGIVYQVGPSSLIDYVYVKPGVTFNASQVGTHSKHYTAVTDADKLGYMYADNKVEGDTAMFMTMNRWVDGHSGHGYAKWARPGLAEINGDLPVLLLSEFDGTKEHQGGFRSLSTYEGGPVLQYGGPVRDTINFTSPQLNGALTRATAGNSLFIYGDVVVAPTVPVSADKVSVYEHASILATGSLVTKAGGSKVAYDDTYVGITFDNSKKYATATIGVNYGLNGGTSYFSRDWHMFSTPLSHAPLGFNYLLADNTTNTNSAAYYSSGDIGNYFCNPWVHPDYGFFWLNNNSDGPIRYWMWGWTNSQGPRTPLNFVESRWVDGYFPSSLSNPSEFGATCESGTDEDGRYPYGMDFFTWTEPDYHWINFKRNGPNHWHSDGDHEHIDYEPFSGATKNVNEDNLIVGRGYMASIATQTFMQSHGTLNTGAQSITLTSKGAHCKGWNLVGNPFHGYLDFDEVATSSNLTALDVYDFDGDGPGLAVPFYVVYNADMYTADKAETAFRYYPKGGSGGGEYANRFLHPHQGFYVKAKDEHTLTFTESMLKPRDFVDQYGGGGFRDERPAYPLVNLYLSSNNGCADVTVIELERPEWGGAIKLKELRVGNGVFYAQHDNTHFAALFAKVGTERVPLWFEAKEDDIYTIKWNTANGEFHSMYLIDNILGVQYDMLRNDTYSFEGHVGDYPSRFYIVFNVTDVDEHPEGNGFVFFDDSQWVVTGEGDLEFIDALGQVLVRKHINGGQSRVTVPDVSPGVYLFRLSNSEGTRVQKVIVKR